MDFENFLSDESISLEMKEKISFLINNISTLEIQLSFFDSVLNQIEDFILITSLNGEIEFANEKAKKLYGKSTSELLGNSCFIIKTHEGYPTFKEIVEKVLTEKSFQQIIPIEVDLEDSNATCYLSLKVMGALDKENQLISLFWYGRDITKFVEKEIEVIESENFLNRLVANIPGAVYRCLNDENWTMHYISDGCEKLFEYKPEELVNNKIIAFNQLIRKDYREKVWEKWQEEMKIKSNIEYEYPIITKSGEERWILDRSQIIRNDDEEIEFIEGIMLDITEKKKYEKKIIETQKMDSIGYLTAGIAHDFNNMLTGILGMTEFLLTDETDAEKRNDLNGILNTALRAKDLTNKLLGCARKGKNVSKAVNLNQIISEMVDILARTISSKIRIETKLQQDIFTIDGDPSQLNQVFMNLCTNAIEAMPNGGILRIETKNELKDGSSYVVVSVGDTGIGMSEHVQEHLFEPFFTTKNDPNRKGTGLGLPTVYGIVNNHGGTIDYETSIGKGTIFKITFKAGTLKEEKSEVLKIKMNLQAKKILVAEDEEVIQKLIAKMLDSMNISCIITQNGEEAIQRFKNEKDNIKGVILDLKMPVMDGKTAFYELKKIDPNVKVLISTGYGENEEVQELLSAGAIGLLAKPFRRDELLTAINSFK